MKEFENFIKHYSEVYDISEKQLRSDIKGVIKSLLPDDEAIFEKGMVSSGGLETWYDGFNYGVVWIIEGIEKQLR